ncbi:glutathione S-transferase [Nannocystis exedens]|uniref:Glutathione S-transferase n=1 Tax=Nannocystis exedens TaxID=54 RepID=A0A1I1VW51_9BACT|nr:glutathione S-transferase family protein [Nannocystis exedens]PCC72912.1 Disulfide-bond oxidoreductase YfcG [Nannocystis exedens]SFD87336.1 glutathione S-transferase [Nannocystis exedens]
MITLYGFGRVHRKVIGETRDLRVQWALEELGLPYRVHPLDHTGGEFDSPAYAAISPFHQAPVIDDDGVVVAETGAILLYLADKAGALPTDAAGRAAVVQWCFAALTTVEPPVAMILLIDLGGLPGGGAQRAALVAWARRGFDGLERRLDGRTWIAADDFTVADILLATVLRQIRRTALLADYPRLRAYYDRALARPAWRRTLERYAERLGVTVADIR